MLVGRARPPCDMVWWLRLPPRRLGPEGCRGEGVGLVGAARSVATAAPAAEWGVGDPEECPWLAAPLRFGAGCVCV